VKTVRISGDRVGWDKLALGERGPTMRLAMVGLRPLRGLVPPYPISETISTGIYEYVPMMF
jgi:hypothetical protein